MPTKEIENDIKLYLVDTVTGEKREVNSPICESIDASKIIATEITSDDINRFFGCGELTASINRTFISNNKRRLSGKKLIPWRKLYRAQSKEVKRRFSFEQWKNYRGILF